ncbi:MAG: glycosyltransferase family 39 protein [Chloroflexi bacterium]|nr:glycosyltransferase family 39 protein [Chloroflexota bacterium]
MKSRKLILASLLLILTLAPRLSSLDSFVTLDEPFWLSVGANYYYALGQRELENTVYEYHPAVTTMSLITAAFLVDFPDYRGFGQGYFDVDKEKFDPFLIEHGHDPMYLLYLARLFQVALIALFALIIFQLLSVLFGDEKAFLVTVLTSSAPYFLGHSRVLSHEAMVAFFVLGSILGLMVYLDRRRKWYYLFASAACAALAQLTKSSAMAMFPVIGLMLTVSVFEKTKEHGLKSSLLDHLKIFGIWLGLLALVYFILWPGMWVAPGKMLYEVYGNAFSYAFQGARLQVTHEVQTSSFKLAATATDLQGFAKSIIWRATPVSWAGFLLACVFLLFREEGRFFTISKKMFIYLLFNAFMFILLFSLAKGRNSPHYIIASHVSIDMIAALGWASLFGWLAEKWSQTRLGSWAITGTAALLICLQLAGAFAYYPYYYVYSNPIWNGVTGREYMSDYGEGFEHAAAYLAQKPDAKNLNVFAFRGRGPFSYFFPGRTIILNPLFMEEPDMGSVLERLAQSDYIVINDAFGLRTERTALFVQALESIEPEYSIQVKGAYPIHIYRVADLPPSFYETLSK